MSVRVAALLSVPCLCWHSPRLLASTPTLAAAQRHCHASMLTVLTVLTVLTQVHRQPREERVDAAKVRHQMGIATAFGAHSHDVQRTGLG